MKFRAIGSAEALLVDLSTDEPRNMQEALSGMAKEKWIKAMDDEISSMSSNKV